MWFAEPGPRRFRPRRDRPVWRVVLFAAAVVGALAALQPWVKVHFVRLFGEVFGPPAWQSSAGFTLLSTSALLVVMTLGETQARSTQTAVRPASLLLAAVMTLALVLHGSDGPGHLRGATASWTVSFYVGALAAAGLLLSCGARYVSYAPRRARPVRDQGAPRDQSSSGPPT